jgi:hypothetical protein
MSVTYCRDGHQRVIAPPCLISYAHVCTQRKDNKGQNPQRQNGSDDISRLVHQHRRIIGIHDAQENGQTPEWSDKSNYKLSAVVHEDNALFIVHFSKSRCLPLAKEVGRLAEKMRPRVLKADALWWSV